MSTSGIKNLAAVALRKASSLVAPPSTGRKVILCLHSVNPAANHSTIHPKAFEGILKYLTEHADVMALETLLDGDREGNPRPAVALTFDDGHKDNLTHALPIAKDHGVTFSVYVTVALLEGDARARIRFTAQLRQEKEDFTTLSWDDAEKLLEAGCPIGSHTWDHPMLSHLPDEGIEFQLRESKELISRRLGLHRLGMCYPYGKIGRNVDQRVIRATERAGYTYGLCVEHRGIRPGEDRFAIPRFIINSGDLGLLERQLTGGEDFHGAISRRMPGFLARVLSPSDFHEPAHMLPPLIAFPPPPAQP